MNIQIFGTAKSFDTKKAQRWFKERGIRFQMIDLAVKGMSRGEFESVCRAVGGWEALFDPDSKDFVAGGDLESPKCLKSPIVRNGRQATVGYCPEAWETWE